MATKELGLLFPVGGAVAPEQMIGRTAIVEDLADRLREHMHVLLRGPRRIGKTTVCDAVCATLRASDEYLIIRVEAPEQSSAAGFCQLLIDQTTRIDLERQARRLARATRPFVEGWLADQGVPLDLSQFGADVPSRHRRSALELPLQLARRRGTRAVFFIDEIQRSVSYADGAGLISDLLSLYAGNHDVVVLADGSDERTSDALLDDPYAMRKLVTPRELSETISTAHWRPALTDRFEQAGTPIAPERLEELLRFGAERPFETMTAALCVAFVAQRAGAGAVDRFALDKGLREANTRLEG